MVRELPAICRTCWLRTAQLHHFWQQPDETLMVSGIPAAVTETPHRLQNAWRSLSMRVLLKLLSAEPGSNLLSERLKSGRKLRVLFIRHDRKIGDLVMTTGIMRALSTSSPNITMDVLTAGEAAPVLAGNPHIRNLYRHWRNDWRNEIKLLRELRRARYDIVVDGRVNHLSRHGTLPLFLVACACPVRIGAKCGHERLYSCTVTVPPGLHFVEQAATVLAPFGVDAGKTDLQPEIFMTDAELTAASKLWEDVESRSKHRFKLLVNISAAGMKRRWPDDRFIEALVRARSHPLDPTIIVMSSARDREAAARIADAVGAKAVATPKLRDAIALVATCDFLFTPDTGIAHIASAFRKPTLDLLLAEPIAPGPRMRKDAFTPYHTPGRNVYSPDMTITSLGAKEVIEALEEELDALLPAAGKTREIEKTETAAKAGDIR